MIPYMEVGEWRRFRKKLFRCVEAVDIIQQCSHCDLKDDHVCSFVRCMPDERTDKKRVHFKTTKKTHKDYERKKNR